MGLVYINERHKDKKKEIEWKTHLSLYFRNQWIRYGLLFQIKKAKFFFVQQIFVAERHLSFFFYSLFAVLLIFIITMCARVRLWFFYAHNILRPSCLQRQTCCAPFRFGKLRFLRFFPLYYIGWKLAQCNHQSVTHTHISKLSVIWNDLIIIIFKWNQTAKSECHSIVYKITKWLIWNKTTKINCKKHLHIVQSNI